MTISVFNHRGIVLKTNSEAGSIAALCDYCQREIGEAGRIILPLEPKSDLRALCSVCLEVDAHARADATDRGISLLEFVLLKLVAVGCNPQPEEMY
jgi:hypothetical protein